MNLSYAAAEYFIQSLGRSSNFSIRYEYLIFLIDQANKDVVSYLKEESKKDLMFIFKKFPDVFICNKESVTLTDAFLSLYAFPSSTNFSINYKCFNAFEVAVIEYFKLILIRCGTCCYFQLFNMLLTQNGHELASYFSHYKMTDMYKFFQTHADTFTILNDAVYLRRNPSLDLEIPHVDHKIASHSMRKLTKSTYFLLTCFESLHYIELRQCICFVMSGVRQYLNGHSLLKQREMFENLPEIAMTQCGFLSLKNFSVSMLKSRKVRLILLMVSILAFEREMHFQKLVREVKNRTSSDVNYSLCDGSASDQFRFFKDFSEFFEIRDDGYVRLISSFIFPLCSFETSSPNVNTLNFQSNVDSCSADLQKVSLNSPVTSNVKTMSQSVNAECREMSGNISIINNVQMRTINVVGEGIQMNGNLPVASNGRGNSTSTGRIKSADSPRKNLPNIVQTQSSNSSSHLESRKLNSELQIIDQRHVNLAIFINSLTNLAISPAVLNIRLKFSILYLLQCFVPPACQNILKSVLHVLGDVKDSFLSLPPAVQNAFVKQFYVFIRVESGKVILNDISSLLDMDEKEKVAMVITYIIIKESKIHFQRLADILISNKVNCLLSSYSTSGQFKYLKTFAEYFNISGSGYITLNESFDYINSIVDSHIVSLPVNSHGSKMLPKGKQFDVSSKSEPLHCSSNMGSSVTSNGYNASRNDIKSSSKISLNPTNEISKLSNVLSNSEIKIPVAVYKKLVNVMFHLRSFFNSLVAKHVLETFLHSLIDEQTYFNSLTTQGQYKFVEIYFQYINNDSFFEISCDPAATLKEEQKVILLVTYLLIKENSLHFQNIIIRLNNFGVKYAICTMKTSKQFSYFKCLINYFVINGDGYVSLNSSFYSLSSIISSVSALVPEIQSKLNCNIQIKNQNMICPEKKEASSIPLQTPTQNIVSRVDFKESKRITSFKKEDSVNSSNCNEELINMITDYCVSILSSCEKMKIVNLCQRMNTCHMKRLQNYFSFFTISEKVNFFRNLSLYFDICENDFVCLKKGVKTSYMPKSDLAALRSRAVSESAISAGYASNTESVNSYVSETPSCTSSASFKKIKLRTRRSVKLRKKLNKLSSKQNDNTQNVPELQSKNKQKSSKSEGNLTSITCNGSFNKSESTHKPFSKSSESKGQIKAVLCDKVVEKRNLNVASQYSNEKHKTNLCVKDSVKNLDKISADVPLGIISKDIKLQAPRQPIENQKTSSTPSKSNKMFNESSNCVNSSNGGVHTKSNPKSFPVGSLRSSVSDFSSNLQLNGYSENSKNYSEVLPVNISDSILNHNNLDSKDVHDNSFESYGTELLNSFLGELELDLTTSSTDSGQVTKYEENNTLDKHYSSNFSDLKGNFNNPHAETAICDTLKTIPKPSDLFNSNSHKCNSKVKGSNLSNASVSGSENAVKELRAVNFFCTILGKYEVGVSADFLIRHLNLASSEVQTFMFHYFQKDPLSFFSKHKEVFYVSPQTHNVYLLQNTFYPKA